MATIKLRRGTSSEWFTENPILSDGEVGIESAPGTVPDKGKIGDGATSWNSLPYSITSDWVSLAERGVADGVASLDGSATVPDAQIPATIARDTEVTAAIASLNGTSIANTPGHARLGQRWSQREPPLLHPAAVTCYSTPDQSRTPAPVGRDTSPVKCPLF